MGKRSSYELKPRDKYYTPLEAIRPLTSLLGDGVTYAEPCAGDGRLVDQLEQLLPMSICPLALDIEPDADWIIQKDALTLTDYDLSNCGFIITNPPYTWGILRPLMDKFISLRPTILLLPADYMHNQRMKPYMEKCVWVKSVGRIKWIEGSKATGVDNYAWFLFDKNKPIDEPTSFYVRD